VARYYFHLKTGSEILRDEEGDDLPSQEDARATAVRAARELVANAIKAGRIPDVDAVLIEDENGNATSLPIEHAIPQWSRR
jgi:hypothetical protein